MSTLAPSPDALIPDERRALVERGGPLAWQWCYVPEVASAAPAPFHVEALDWGWGLEAGVRPDTNALLLALFRGGAKSATAESIVAMTACRLTRRYVLYVSDTQKLADDHVTSIGGILANELLRQDYPHLNRVRVDRAGNTEIWRHNRIRVGGVTVDAIGLDVNVRGARVNQYRPDLIVIDDCDSRHDSIEVSQKKIETITESIIPAGGPDVAVLVAQNVPNEHGFVAKLVDGTATYLVGARIIGPVPAVEGCQYQSEPDETGLGRWKITAGTPTWPEGYPLERAEADLNLEGPDAFESERQHNRKAHGGQFDPKAWVEVGTDDIPADGVKWCRGWDFASSENKRNDRSACVLVGRDRTGKWWLTDADAGWWPVSKVEKRLVEVASSDGQQVQIDIPKDPAQAGTDQAQRRAAMLSGYRVHVTPQNRSTGSKLVRAQGIIAQQQAGNVHVLRGHTKLAEMIAECNAFTDGSQGSHDDLVDALTGAFNVLAGGPQGPAGSSSALASSSVAVD